jgi:hypothetical protein
MPLDIDMGILSVCMIVLTWRQIQLARALREQAQLTREAFESIGFVVEQLNATPGERVAMQWERLERLRLLLKTNAARMRD